jgi:hypothetical protein
MKHKNIRYGTNQRGRAIKAFKKYQRNFYPKKRIAYSGTSLITIDLIFSISNYYV